MKKTKTKTKPTKEETQSEIESLEGKARTLCVLSMLECFVVMENGHRTLVSIPQDRLDDLRQTFMELGELDQFYKGFANILGTIK